MITNTDNNILHYTSIVVQLEARVDLLPQAVGLATEDVSDSLVLFVALLGH